MRNIIAKIITDSKTLEEYSPQPMMYISGREGRRAAPLILSNDIARRSVKERLVTATGRENHTT